MTIPMCTIVIIIVIALVVYLIYSQSNQTKFIQMSGFNANLNSNQPSATTAHSTTCQKCDHYKNALLAAQANQGPQVTNVTVDHDTDPYSDSIKKQDLYSMYDPLTYPQMRLPREVLEKYNKYYEKNGSYPPFGQATQPMFDNPILNGVLIKQVDENEPFGDNVPSSVPLFRVKSAKNTNRFFYYILERGQNNSKFELKIPLDHVKINNIRYNNADFYGLPEIYDGDCIENIAVYPNAKFKCTLYKQYHFP